MQNGAPRHWCTAGDTKDLKKRLPSAFVQQSTSQLFARNARIEQFVGHRANLLFMNLKNSLNVMLRPVILSELYESFQQAVHMRQYQNAFALIFPVCWTVGNLASCRLWPRLVELIAFEIVRGVLMQTNHLRAINRGGEWTAKPVGRKIYLEWFGPYPLSYSDTYQLIYVFIRSGWTFVRRFGPWDSWDILQLSFKTCR